MGSLETYYNTTPEFQDNLSSVIVNQKSMYAVYWSIILAASRLQCDACSMICLQAVVYHLGY